MVYLPIFLRNKMSIAKNIYLADLYDLYYRFLTPKQQQYFADYYLGDLSLAEIAANYELSRNAIFDQIKHAENKLLECEEKLHFYQKMQKIEQLEFSNKQQVLDILKE